MGLFIQSGIYTKNKLERHSFTSLFFISVQIQTKNYFLLLCLFFLSLFLRLCVDILCLFFFFPLGIASKFYGLILLFIISLPKG